MNSKFLVYGVIVFFLFLLTIYKTRKIFPKHKVLSLILTCLAFIVMLAWQSSYRIDGNLITQWWYRPYGIFAGTIMGLWTSFMIYCLGLDLLDLSHRMAHKASRSKIPKFNAQRRELLSSWVPAGILGASGLTTGIGTLSGVAGPKVYEVEVPIKNLPDDLIGFSIAQISDLHVGSTIDRAFTQNVVDITNKLGADIVAVTGDLIDGLPEVLADDVAPLAQLKSRFGTYYVTGNHEYYWGGKDWLNMVKSLRMNELLNKNVVIQKGESKVLIGGVPDNHAPRFYAEHKLDFVASAQTDQSVDLRILLAHRPDLYREAKKHGYHLMLSGHTHGGQFFPWNIFVAMAYRFYKGLNNWEDLWVYVNSGTGYWGPMNRFMVPSEVTHIKLVRA